MIFQFREGSTFNQKEAQAVGEELEKIRTMYGDEIKPVYVVRSAEEKESILHNFFEWDNELAAHHYRLDQAREIIRAIMVVGLQDEKTDSVRHYVNVHRPNEKEGIYIRTEDALKDENFRIQVLRDALSELNSFKRKYKNLKELSKVFQVVDELEIEINQKSQEKVA